MENGGKSMKTKKRNESIFCAPVECVGGVGDGLQVS
jgi:hypothetical protein